MHVNKALQPGTKVLIYEPNIRNGKLSISYSGPFEILRRRFKDSYEILCTKTNRKFFRNLRHIRILKEATQNPLGNQEDEIDAICPTQTSTFDEPDKFD